MGIFARRRTMKLYHFIITPLYAIHFKRIEPNAQHPEIWYVPTDTVPIIAMQISFPIGYAFDPQDKLGLATLLAATLDEGAGELDSDSFREALVNQQIHLSYSASSDRLTLNLNFFKFDIQKALALAKLSLNKPRFDIENIELMRSQLLSAIDNGRKQPDALASRLLQQEYYKNHVFAKPSLGTLQTLKNITRDDLIKLHKKVSIDKAFVSVVGDISETEIIDFVSNLLKEKPKKSDLNTAISDYNIKPENHKFNVYSDVPQTTILMATPAIKRTHPEYFAYSLATHILGGGGFGSYLVDNLRENKGLTYSASAYLDSSLVDGRMIIQFATDNKKIDVALSEAQKTLHDLAKNGVTQKQLDKARVNLKGQYVLMFETNNDISGLAQNLYSYGLPHDYPLKRDSLYDAVTLEQVNRTMKKLFTQPLTIITVGGNKQVKKFNTLKADEIVF
jgi:zinc protease